MSYESATPSLDELIRLHGEKRFQGFVNVQWPSSHAIFIKQLYEILDEIIRSLEDDADLLYKSSEEEISRAVVRQLQRAGYDATAEAYVRGHVDIKVTTNDRRWHWLGESKIHRKYSDLNEALLQLLTRYSTGRDADGGCLIIVHNKRCNEVLDNWHEWLRVEGTVNLKRTEPDDTPRCFRSIHEHDSSAEYRVRHMGVHLYYNPRDKSARARSS